MNASVLSVWEKFVGWWLAGHQFEACDLKISQSRKDMNIAYHILNILYPRHINLLQFNAFTTILGHGQFYFSKKETLLNFFLTCKFLLSSKQYFFYGKKSKWRVSPHRLRSLWCHLKSMFYAVQRKGKKTLFYLVCYPTIFKRRTVDQVWCCDQLLIHFHYFAGYWTVNITCSLDTFKASCFR